jgi:hypothetical protein
LSLTLQDGADRSPVLLVVRAAVVSAVVVLAIAGILVASDHSFIVPRIYPL